MFRSTPTVIATVGLPARGKTYIAKKLARYLNWIGIKTRVFNVGEYRRRACSQYRDSSFFDPKNEEAKSIRNACAVQALEDMCSWLADGGQVAIFDATNSTRERRELIVNKCTQEYCFMLLFVESVCNDPMVIHSNIMEVKVHNPDYKDLPSDEAFKDFKERIHQYELQYEPLDEVKDADKAFIKIFNVGERFIVNKIFGHVQSRVVYFLMNIHVLPRTIYLTRNGESVLNLQYRMAGNPPLSQRGKEFAVKLSEYIENQNIPDLIIWTSEMQRSIETAAKINAHKEKWKALNELDAGLCQGLTYKEMAERFPEKLAMRDKDKFHFRYPNGESYQDLVARLEPVIMELERAENLLVITHQAVARCIIAYFTNVSSADLPYIKVPLHCVMKLTPCAYGCHVEEIPLGVDAVNTHRARPKNCSPSRTIEEALETTPGYVSNSKRKNGVNCMDCSYDNAGLENLDSLLR